MPRDARRYLAYLMRLWDAGAPGAPRWRASLEDAQSGERRGFADLAGLVAYLEAQMEADAARDAATEDPNETEPPTS